MALANEAKALIIFVRDLEKWPHLEDLRNVRGRSTSGPLTLITEPRVANYIPLATIEVEHLLFPSNLDRLPTCVMQKLGNSFRAQVAHRLRADQRISTREKALLISLFLADSPPRTISEWAKMAHVSASTVKYRLRRIPGRPGVSARVAIGINLFLSGLDEVGGIPATWAAISGAVNVDQRRLRASLQSLGVGSEKKDLLKSENLAEKVAEAISLGLTQSADPNFSPN